jgi:hypothetical protein
LLRCALQQIRVTDVRFGPEADIADLIG